MGKRASRHGGSGHGTKYAIYNYVTVATFPLENATLAIVHATVV
jgi:hypothetical protein